MSVTEKFAAWAAETPDIRSPGALALARRAVTDVAACMLAGSADQAPRNMYSTVRNWGSGLSIVVGQPESLAPPWAALVNGAAAHAFDYDDNYYPAKSHATAVLVPALLALADETGASGHALLDAYVVGLEIMGRVGEGVNLTHYQRGWHATSTVGAIGVAAGCARLLGLDTDAMQAAISLATSMAGGSKRQFGTAAKPFHAGLSAKNGLIAASMAAGGLRGQPEALDGQWSFRDLFAGPDSPGYDKALKSLGSPLAIEQYGLAVKIYPCCGSVHKSMDGLLDLRAEHGFTAEEVDSVDVVVSEVNRQNLMYPEPTNEMEMRFSMQYCLSVGLLRGALKVSDFQPGMEMPDVVRPLLSRVHMSAHAENTVSTAPDEQKPTVVTVRLKDGRAFETRVQHPRGSLDVPITEDDLAAKFRDCAAQVLEPDAVEAALSLLSNFGGLGRVSDFTALLGETKESARKSA